MNYMYILECADSSFYTGSTKNLERRLWQHQNGQGANYTKKRLPVKLVYCEPYERIDYAFNREKQVQGWSRRKKQALIENNFENLIEYSKNYTQFERPDGVAPDVVAPFPEPVEGELVEGRTVARPATASTGSASATPPEPAEGNTGTTKLDDVIRKNLEGLGYEE